MGRTRDERWADLLRRANGGDRTSYIQFLSEVAPVLRGIILARCGNHSDESEDILQTTLIAVHEKRHTWRDTEPVSAWVYAIARYKAIDALRKYGRTRMAPLGEHEDNIADDTIIDPTVTGDLDRLLAQLDTVPAAIVREVKLNGLSAEEAGQLFGMTAGAIRVTLHRAMARLSTLAQQKSGNAMGDRKIRK